MGQNNVEHDEKNHRWVIRLPEGIAELRYIRKGPRLLDLHHTGVPPALRGQGIAGELVRGALVRIREQGDKIVATCPYVAQWLERHPEQQDLLELSIDPDSSSEGVCPL